MHKNDRRRSARIVGDRIAFFARAIAGQFQHFKRRRLLSVLRPGKYRVCGTHRLKPEKQHARKQFRRS